MLSPDNKENELLPSFVPPPTPLLKKIGFGTGVSVYHLDRSPCNHATRSPWALKTVNRQHKASHFQERLENEAKILKDLNHPNIVGFRGFSKTEDGRKVLAMEECSESLGDLIEKFADNGGIRYGVNKILTVVAGVSNALQYLHEERGLLHGDLKSFNVLIKGNFEKVKLCDFGVSLELNTAKVEDYVGTEAWTAPEVLGEGPLTDRADIFSLGLIIWEMLALKPPHVDFTESFSPNSTLDESVIEHNYGSTPDLPKDLPRSYTLVKELFEWCTQQRWNERPSARDILEKLSENGVSVTTSFPQITL